MSVSKCNHVSSGIPPRHGGCRLHELFGVFVRAFMIQTSPRLVSCSDWSELACVREEEQPCVVVRECQLD